MAVLLACRALGRCYWGGKQRAGVVMPALSSPLALLLQCVMRDAAGAEAAAVVRAVQGVVGHSAPFGWRPALSIKQRGLATSGRCATLL